MTPRRHLFALAATAATIFTMYILLLWSKIDPVGAVLLSILCSLGALSILGGSITLLRSFPDAAALRRARKKTAPQDGRLEAFSGTIEAEGSELDSPVTATVALMYDLQNGEKALRRAIDLRASRTSPNPMLDIMSAQSLGTNLTRQGRIDEGRFLLDRARQALERRFDSSHWRRGENLCLLGESFAAAGEAEQAATFISRGMAILEATFGTEHTKVRTLRRIAIGETSCAGDQ